MSHKVEKTGYLGPEGTWTEEAASRLSPDTELVPYSNICRIVDDVDSGVLSLGVLPVENSIGGGVIDSLDCLSDSRSVSIVSERIFSIDHVLMGKGDRKDVKCVLSHRNAIAQCRKSLSALFPGIPLEFSTSTAEAARRAGQDHGIAVVGSRRLAEIYGLKVLAEGISDHSRNYTRFVMISRNKAQRTGRDRTSISVILRRNEPASLWRFLGIFAALGINLSRVESRPDPESPGEYRFFLDMFGHVQDDRIGVAIKAIGVQCSSVRILGSYPRDDWPSGK